MIYLSFDTQDHMNHVFTLYNQILYNKYIQRIEHFIAIYIIIWLSYFCYIFVSYKNLNYNIFFDNHKK